MKIVTVSCDKYADSAPAFVDLIRSKWPACPHDIVFVTNKKRLQVEQPVYYLNSRDDMSFGWRLKEFIKQHYTDEHLLFMMSDYFVKQVDSVKVAEAHQFCAMPGISHVRLRPMPHPQLPYSDDFGEIIKGSRYSLSLQPGIWRTNILYDLLRQNENPWQTEIEGSFRTALAPGRFLSAKKAAIYHLNYYRKGHTDGVAWVRENVARECWPEAVRDV